MRSNAIGLFTLLFATACGSSSVNDHANTGGTGNGGNANGGSGGGNGGSSTGGSAGTGSGSGTGGTVSCGGSAGDGPVEDFHLSFAAEDDFDKGGNASGLLSVILGDCTPAVVVAERDQSQIAVIRIGEPAYPAPELVGSGRSIGTAQAGDVTRDGIVDLVATQGNGTIGSLLTFEGTTNGSFAAGPEAPLDFDPSGEQSTLVLADFNADQNLDAAVTSHADPRLQILLGDGAGGFSEADSYSGFGQPVYAGVAELDGTAGLDLFVVTTDSLVLFQGEGNGSFLAQQPIPVAGSTNAVGAVTGDFNGDQLTDILIATGGLGGRIQAFISNGTGLFVGFDAVDVGPDPGLPIAADFNRDGVLDVATGHEAEQNVSIMLGHGDGTFAGEAIFPATAGVAPSFIIPVRVAEGDFRPSILVGYRSSPNMGRLANISAGN